MKEKLVSIIVPAYNASGTIVRCISSLVKYKKEDDDIEIIVIDDGSTDDTPKLLKYLKETENIKVYTQCNKGVSNARNYGLNVANGKYVMFVDADDYITADVFDLIKANEKEDFILFSVDETPFQVHSIKNVDHIQQEILFPMNGDMNKYRISSPWSKAYKLKIIKDNKIKFDERLKIGEDAAFNYEFLKYTKQVLCIDRNMYFYDVSGDSVTRRYNKDYLYIDVNYQRKIDTLLNEDVNSVNRFLGEINGVIRCCSDYFMNQYNIDEYKEIQKDFFEWMDAYSYFGMYQRYRKSIRKYFSVGQNFLIKIIRIDKKCIFLPIIFWIVKNIRRRK